MIVCGVVCVGVDVVVLFIVLFILIFQYDYQKRAKTKVENFKNEEADKPQLGRPNYEWGEKILERFLTITQVGVSDFSIWGSKCPDFAIHDPMLGDLITNPTSKSRVKQALRGSLSPDFKNDSIPGFRFQVPRNETGSRFCLNGIQILGLVRK